MEEYFFNRVLYIFRYSKNDLRESLVEELGPKGLRDSSSFKDFETELHGSPNPVLKNQDCGVSSTFKFFKCLFFTEKMVNYSHFMEPIIEIKNLTKRFGSQAALQKINLKIHYGEICGIIGMSGAGKSTLIRCLTSLEKATEGVIFLGNKELTALPEKELRQTRQQIGMIFQHFNLFASRTAFQNILYPMEISGLDRHERQSRALELLNLVGLKGKQNHYPSQLSGGEKQRVAIARALANNPMILLCDEATSALDPQTTQSILELLFQLNQKLGLTIFLITHEMEVVRQICTHVSVLEGGEIVEQGRVIDLFANPQHPTTRRFLYHLSHQFPDIHQEPDQEILQLFFQGKSAREPLICRLIRQFNVDVNILLGGIDRMGSESIGHLVIEISGRKEERAKARLFLEESGVRCQVYDQF